MNKWNQETGSSQASKAAKSHDVEETPPRIDPEEFRLQKIAEALKVREELDRLRAESDARVREERRTFRGM